jgi:MFS family permease
MVSWWFGFHVVSGSTISVIWPSQIASIVGNQTKELYNGFIPAVGSFVGMITPPISGILSDYTTFKYGKRRIYIFTGTIIGFTFFILSSLFHQNSGNIYLLMLCIMGFEFGVNWGYGPFSGFIPDLVRVEQVGLGSGWLGMAYAGGALVGDLLAGFLTTPNNYWLVYSVLGGIFAISAIPTLVGIHEVPLVAKEHLSFKKFFLKFYFPWKIYHDFWWVTMTRAFMSMGVYGVLPFIQYFLENISSVKDATLMSSIVVAVIVIISIPSAIIGGWISDKIGRKIMVYISSGIMATIMSIFSGISFYPNLIIIFICAIIFGIGYGCYISVDWGLALDTLPHNANVAKDMGIWGISHSLPQVLSPLLNGVILDEAKKHISLTASYSIIFAITSFWFILSTVFIYPINIQKQQHNSINEIEEIEEEKKKNENVDILLNN